MVNERTMDKDNDKAIIEKVQRKSVEGNYHS